MLEHYGWSDSLRSRFALAEGFVPARVLVQQRGHYEVASGAGVLTATLSGRFVHGAAEGDFPVTGDWVAIVPRPGEATCTIQQVLPRSSTFVRRAAGPGARPQVVAANVDTAFLAVALNADFSVRRLERYLATAWESGADPVIVLTKADLCDDAAGLKAEVEAIAFGVPVHAIAAPTGEGLDGVRAHLVPGKTAVLLGSSGVGKSTLVNVLAGREMMAVRALRRDGTGQHTTTHRELILLPGGALILDTPGMRELGLWDSEAGVSQTFTDIEALARACRFGDCRHTNEPGCAVHSALADGSLDAARWEAYGKLQRELAFLERKDDPKARFEARKMWIRRQKGYRAGKKLRDPEE